MQWTADAEAAVKKIPFFVRKKVRARVEKEAREAGKSTVSVAEVNATQKKYLRSMQSEVKGYQIDTCFGPNGCPNRANPADRMAVEIEQLLKQAKLLAFLHRSVKGDLKFHHEFRVTLAECPNACSQPQIKDIGIVGAALPQVTDRQCTQCEACTDTCKEKAILLDTAGSKPHIEAERCLACGQCMVVCPTDTLAVGCRGFRVQLGGKLGRHPQLARELPGVYTESQVLDIVRDCLKLYKQKSTGGRRFAQILSEEDFQRIAGRYPASG
jgi:dissimilatory sulfite reductase (desulfoviridin) alpha/beta subunit